MWATVAAGALVVSLSAHALPLARLDARFLLLAVLTALVSTFVAVQIPRISGRITVSDTFIFLVMLLYGGEAAILLAAAESACATLRISRRPRTVMFNAAVMAVSTFVTVWSLRLLFGSLTELPRQGYSANFISALCVMALIQYVMNSGLIAVEKSLKTGQPFRATWHRYYLWTSITYFAGASAAGIIARIIGAVGFYAVFATTPIIAIVYFTYHTYLKNMAAAAAQAEQAERHVEELNHYISERRRVEDERDQLLVREQEARAQAENANRLKDEFLATLSHELRTPLTSILGWAGLLRMGKFDEATCAQALDTIERNARTQAQLIDELLDVSRIISGKLTFDTKTVNLASVVESAINVVRPAAQAKRIDIVYDCASQPGPVSGDPARLQQVVWNLLFNAVKFTPEGGRVEVRLEREGSRARVTVSDTGKGIDADFLPHVFDRFRQADSSSTRQHGGLGLGLAIVRHLVEFHGGTVSAESDGEGRGATFTVTLPLLAVRLEPDHFESLEQHGKYRLVSAGVPSLGGLRVLVVDDEADARNMISAVLAQSGAEVRTCASTREALDALAEWRPDVLMSDIGMPQEDGFALIEQVRALHKDGGGLIPAAALTAYAREEDRQRILAAGFQQHVAKPIGSSELVMAVAHLAGRAA
jgi:signal transduction histidine kinase